MIRTVIAAVLLAGLTACATDTGLSEEPGFIVGYGDGCATAQEQGKSFSTERHRDAEAFESDRAYRSGWRQGWQQCKDPAGRANDGGLILGDEDRF
ncbi:MAG: hypothetical protein U5J99_11875 [Parvularculaceae bacterium]|nr:hypothetical protein [Parvularculaceae bacterium]